MILSMKKSLKEHYNAVSDLGCILCRHLGFEGTPAELHHIRRGGGRRADAPVIPLCPEHHRGNSGVHGMGRKAFHKHYGITEEELLEETHRLVKRRSQ